MVLCYSLFVLLCTRCEGPLFLLFFLIQFSDIPGLNLNSIKQHQQRRVERSTSHLQKKTLYITNNFDFLSTNLSDSKSLVPTFSLRSKFQKSTPNHCKSTLRSPPRNFIRNEESISTLCVLLLLSSLRFESCPEGLRTDNSDIAGGVGEMQQTLFLIDEEGTGE